MAEYILHHNGVYNFWTTVADGPCYVSGLTLEQVRERLLHQVGQEGIHNLEKRLERARDTGCSALTGQTLNDCIDLYNRVHHQHKNKAEFVAEFLTIRPDDGTDES